MFKAAIRIIIFRRGFVAGNVLSLLGRGKGGDLSSSRSCDEKKKKKKKYSKLVHFSISISTEFYSTYPRCEAKTLVRPFDRWKERILIDWVHDGFEILCRCASRVDTKGGLYGDEYFERIRNQRGETCAGDSQSRD